MKRIIAFLLLCISTAAFAQAPIQFKNFPIGATPASGDYTWCDQSGVSNRCTFSQVATGISTILGLGTFATANAATPPAIGGTTPNAGSFSSLDLTNIIGLTQCLHVNASGFVSGTGSDCGAGGGGGSFSALTSGINSTATMIVGTGATLSTTGSGTITANAYSGILGTNNGGTGANSLLSASIPVFSGTIISGHCVQWSSTGVQVDSGAGCGSGGSNAFSSITSATNTTAAMVVGSGASLSASGGGTIAATSVTGLSVASGKTLTASNTLTLAGTDSTTFTFPVTTGTVDVLNNAQTFTAAKTFTNNDLLLLGSSTGATTFASANASATNYTLTFPATSDTVVTLGATQTLTNKSVDASEVNTGSVSG